MTPGTWIGASLLLGRDVTADEPYPHICGSMLVGVMTGRPVHVNHRSCAACAQIAAAADAKTRRRR
ncbi:hypothetical protein [Verrucosispora sp. TAA-831]|uniref:hypothetical protein n=1 Tax=Verrucosispora sp. TAA-831 TaxID=3422227 RepID=UPI003D6E230B